MLGLYLFTFFFSVSWIGLGIEGTPFNVTCRVTLPSGVHVESDSLSIQWIRIPPRRNPFRLPIVFSDGSYTVNLTRDPLEKNQENKMYQCRANYSLSIFSSPVVLSNVITIEINCKCFYSQSYSIYLTFYSQFQSWHLYGRRPITRGWVHWLYYTG